MKTSALAIDHGARRTGFAATDALRIATRPLEVFEGAGDGTELVERVAELTAEREVKTLVVGLPVNMDGSEGPRAREVRAFVERLRARLPEVAIDLQDERLSTKVAEELQRDAGVPASRRRAVRDSWSALVILRDWIDGGEEGSGRE
ncbi:MAG: Holliday junction resolvase RuvX [Planctomycetota bacterium]|jgi:putative Holliday junction resolvase|nr:Holliday junction resolvase RuvX [Planctomycetota bacterium]MDP6763337.1 Holliday junction resolvase RuvX [Planctomycetota bacterium]MDP6988766.1 Holliday junction resolvase RuvX [Planctomycetota bacterium]